MKLGSVVMDKVFGEVGSITMYVRKLTSLRRWNLLQQWLTQHTIVPLWLPIGERWPIVLYLFAALVQIFVTLMTVGITAIFPQFAFTGLLEVLGIVLLALTFGMGPSLFAVFIAAILIDFFLLPPRLAFISNLQGALEIVLFIGVGAAVSAIAAQVEQARRNSERAQTELQYISDLLADQAAEMETIFEVMTDGVLVYDSQMQILRANRAAYQIFGNNEIPAKFAISQLKSANPIDMRNATGDFSFIEQYPFLGDLCGNVLTGRSIEDRQLHVIDRTEKVVSMNGEPLRDAMGRVVGAVITVRDETSRCKLEGRTQKALMTLLQVVEHIIGRSRPEEWAGTERLISYHLLDLFCQILGCVRGCIMLIDPVTLRIESVAAVGLSPEQEQEWVSYYEDGEQIDPSVLSCFDAGEALCIDMAALPYNTRPNRIGIAEILNAPMVLEGQLVGILALDYNGAPHVFTEAEKALTSGLAQLAALTIERERLIAARTQAEIRSMILEESTRRMDEFLGIASHELRTPITSAKASVQIVTRQLRRIVLANDATKLTQSSLQAAIQRLERADISMDRLTRLVSDLLDVTRLQKGKIELRRENADLGTLVQDIIDEQQAIWPNREIRARIPLQRVDVLVDIDRIEQVITNFLSNALKYAPAECPITVNLDVMPGHIRVSIRDEGPGLTLEQQQHVWERFYRVSGIEQQQGSGIGLGIGLYISRAIVEQHDGLVGITSEPGKGSTFWFELATTSVSASSSFSKARMVH
jgi:signal transduction histidine kinase/PAS domain-containing protein